MSETGYVYTLCDPRTDEPHYVGATQNPKQRLSQHISGNSNENVQEWISELEDVGLEPEMSLIRVAPVDELSEVEREAISNLAEEWELFNKKDGGYNPASPHDEASGYKRPRIRDPVADKLGEIADQHDYGSTDEAITHVLREAGYEV
jgi:hypothetical protein